ncbi:MAG: restriction endonuclease subunit S [Methylococcales bacterium]|nr:restriction endonuclease subunit S [Methylococcales bacterium]
MKIKFDVTPKELVIVRDILAKYLQEDCTVWIFGSRAKSRSLVGSDLDLAIECDAKIELKLLTALKIAFEDSRLPYRVDVVDMKAVKPYFKEIIDKERVLFPLNHLNKVPVLRFPEFSGEWEVKKLGEVSENVMYGLNSSAINFDGENQYLRITDIDEGSRRFKPNPLTTPSGDLDDKFKLKEGDIVFTRTGASVGKSYLYTPKDGKLYFAGFLIKFTIKLNNPYFIFSQSLRSYYDNWVHVMSVRSGQPGINAEEYKILNISLTSIKEQQKIADFLTQIDSKIEQLSKKKQLLERYKKGLMQKVFSQELRFKDDNGNAYPDWEVKRLGDVTKIYDGTHMTPDYKKEGIPFYSVEHLTSNNFFNTKFISKEVFEKENKRVKLEKGDILMTKIGDIGTSKYINWDVNASFYVSLALIKKTEINNTLFINQYIKSSLFQKELHKRIIHVAFPKKINLGEISHCLINFPCLEEQTKIANFLTELDQKINLVEKQLNGTKDYKKGLLQKMFV